jgi:hypothetical protein
MSTTNTPFQYQRNANGICKSFTYYPNTTHDDGNTLISLWTSNDDLVRQPLSIKNSFISKITSISQDNDFCKIAIIDGENEKHIFAINKRLFCSNFTANLPEIEYKPTEEDLIFAANREIVDEFLQAIYAEPRIHLKIKIVNNCYICTTVRF